MASRKKPSSTGAPPGNAKPPARSTSSTALPEGQGLIPTLPSASTTSKPVGGTVGRAVTARPPARIELSGVAIKKVFDNLAAVVGKVVAAADPAVALPSRLLGSLQEPDSSPGLGLQIEILPPPSAAGNGNAVLGTAGSKVIATGLTDAAGNFTIPLPAGVMLPPGASLSLRVRGAATDAVSVFGITPDLLGPTGYIGTLKLDKQLAPIPAELFAELQQTIDKDSGDAGGGPTVPKLTLGDDADCIRVLENQTSFERFPYGIFFQLIAPKLYVETETIDRQSIGTFNNVVRVDTLIDRMDLSGPISIDEFRESLLRNPAIVGSLGLGYVLRCGQNWQFQGLALGDLVYSLPLAPGEQQQVVVEEQSTTLTVREFDSVIASDTSSATQVSDASSRATFDSALRQSAQGGSSFTSASETGSLSAGGGLLGLLGGPSGSMGETVSGGSTQNWMDGLQNYGSTATQATQTYAEQQAHSFRSAQRTAMRMASTTESTSVTTKTITNHNKLHALTMQYFEVLRQFDITTSYDGVSLVCLVPLDIVWFLPPGQKEHLDDLISNSDLSNAIQWSSQINSAVGAMIGLVSQARSVMGLPFVGERNCALARPVGGPATEGRDQPGEPTRRTARRPRDRFRGASHRDEPDPVHAGAGQDPAGVVLGHSGKPPAELPAIPAVHGIGRPGALSAAVELRADRGHEPARRAQPLCRPSGAHGRALALAAGAVHDRTDSPRALCRRSARVARARQSCRRRDPPVGHCDGAAVRSRLRVGRDALGFSPRSGRDDPFRPGHGARPVQPEPGAQDRCRSDPVPAGAAQARAGRRCFAPGLDRAAARALADRRRRLRDHAQDGQLQLPVPDADRHRHFPAGRCRFGLASAGARHRSRADLAARGAAGQDLCRFAPRQGDRRTVPLELPRRPDGQCRGQSGKLHQARPESGGTSRRRSIRSRRWRSRRS